MAVRATPAFLPTLSQSKAGCPFPNAADICERKEGRMERREILENSSSPITTAANHTQAPFSTDYVLTFC